MWSLTIRAFYLIFLKAKKKIYVLRVSRPTLIENRDIADPKHFISMLYIFSSHVYFSFIKFNFLTIMPFVKNLYLLALDPWALDTTLIVVPYVKISVF